MTRKALLIGAETDKLSGVLHDVSAMDQALTARGFKVTPVRSPHASRAEIVAAFEKLIAQATEDDAIVVYYSGHGGRALSADGPDLEFIVPDDYSDSSETDFRGITNVELSVYLARLTKATANTTAIFDCCHAAHMARQSSDLRVRSLLRPADWRTYETVHAHVERLVGQGLRLADVPLVSNPLAVKLVACAPTQSAWETANRDGRSMGLFTDAIVRTLAEADGLRLSWATLLDGVRRKVQLFNANQRPEVAGPSERQPFELDVPELLNSLPIAPLGPDRVQLLGAPLLGVQLGDTFEIRAAGPADQSTTVASAVVDLLLPTAAAATLSSTVAGSAIAPDARAFRTVAAADALPVTLPSARDPFLDRLAHGLDSRPQLRPADATERAAHGAEVVRNSDDSVVIRDAVGPLLAPIPSVEASVPGILDNLQRMAQAAALRRLTGDTNWPLQHGVDVTWGRVRQGTPEVLPQSGALLFDQDREKIYLTVHNGGDHPVYVSLIDIGISYRIEILTANDASGNQLLPSQSYTLGRDEYRQQLVGVDVSWPDGIDRTMARPESILVLISDSPVDVGLLRQSGVKSTSVIRGSHAMGPIRSSLEQLLAQVGTGATREVGRSFPDPVRFDVVPIDFVMAPTSGPASDRRDFRLDDRPSLPVQLLSGRGSGSRRIAVRLNELIVHKNRALFGDSAVRVDSVVHTGGHATELAYRAETLRFDRVRDEARLPLDNVLLYHGPAVDYLDIAIWVSRDTSNSQALAELMEHQLDAPALHSLAMNLPYTFAGLDAMTAVSALNAGTVLVNTAYELLTGIAGKSIGLYRTSVLAHEAFGIGRHERHPQDFSFTFSIESAD